MEELETTTPGSVQTAICQSLMADIEFNLQDYVQSIRCGKKAYQIFTERVKSAASNPLPYPAYYDDFRMLENLVEGDVLAPNISVFISSCYRVSMGLQKIGRLEEAFVYAQNGLGLVVESENDNPRANQTFDQLIEQIQASLNKKYTHDEQVALFTYKKQTDKATIVYRDHSLFMNPVPQSKKH